MPLIVARPGDRRDRRARQAGPRPALHRRRPPPRRERSPRARPSPSISPNASRGTRFAASSTAQELERRRLARELHDETGQALTSILLGLKAVEDARTTDAARQAAAALRELVVETLQDVRRLAVELRPKALDDFGLVPALERLTDTFAEQTGHRGRLRAPARDERLPAEVETALYRIVQEALTNVVKHARRDDASSVVVTEHDGVGDGA